MSERKMVERESKSTAAALEIPFPEERRRFPFFAPLADPAEQDRVQEETEMQIYEPAKKEKEVAERAREETLAAFACFVGEKSERSNRRRGKKTRLRVQVPHSLYSE